MKLKIINFVAKHYIAFSILIALLAICLGGLIFWGLGNLFILVFKINYEWTYWHGVLMELIYILLKNVLTPSKK